MQCVYLDNNATTKPAPQVLQAINEANEHFWANPSSVHRFGQMVRHKVELARASVANLINAHTREIIFTSGGTESCNLALRGALHPNPPHTAHSQPVRVPVLITTPVEHAAIAEPAQALAQQGVLVKQLEVSPGGWVSPDALASMLQSLQPAASNILVSIQWANNETGAIQPIHDLAHIIRQHRQDSSSDHASRSVSTGRVLFHVDATQAAGKLPVDVTHVPIDLMTISAHKFHGPKGIGALYVRRGVGLHPQLLGGPQESQRRGGTENAPGIIAMGVAADLAVKFLANDSEISRLEAQRDRFEQSIIHALPEAVVNSKAQPDPTDPSEPRPHTCTRLWNTSNLGFPRLEAEAILVALSEQGICASAGAACSSGSLEPSPVLLAMGVPEPVAHGSVRFSLSRMTTDAEIDLAIKTVISVVDKFSKMMPAGM